MSSNRARSAPVAQVAEPAELLGLVARIGDSRHFNRSQRLRSFLEFICQQTLSGNSESICEQFVGHHVFGRPADYDPTADNIVRVEARELRKRLAAYFADEGRSEPLRITVPKGGYVPSVDVAPVAEESQDDSDPTVGDPTFRSPHWAVTAAIVMLVVLSATLAGALWRTSSSHAGAAADDSQPLFSAFWSKVFAVDRTTILSPADSNLSLLQDIRRESITFPEYASGRYFAALKTRPGEGEAGRIQAEIASRYYTSLGDAKALALLASVNRSHSPVMIRFARDLAIEDLKSRNVVLLGSSRSNPWVDLLSQKRRFQIDFDTTVQRPIVRDRSPRAGHPAVYLSDEPGDKPYAAYGIVAAVPNLDGTGVVLLVAGTNGQGTEAAGEFITNPEQFNAFLKEINWDSKTELPLFEAVLKLVTVDGSAILPQVIEHHVPAS